MKGSKKAAPADLRDLPESEGEDFASMLDAMGGLDSVRLKVGERVEVTVVHIAQEALFCSLSSTQEGTLPRTEVTDDDGNLTVAVGDRLELYVTAMRGGIELRRKLSKDAIDIELLERARETQLPVEGTVTGVNKGGLEIAIGGARGFCPIGQADITYVEDPTVFVGQTLEFVVRDVQENGRNVVLSRRALLEARRREQAEKTLADLEVGARVKGKVSRLMEFGAFVDLGGLDGLIPISELSYGQVESVSEVLKAGDEVEVEILRIEDDPKRPGQPRIGLSLKAALPDPFEEHAAALQDGAELRGKVVRIEKYGAFVELFVGVQGLVHISELSEGRVRHPSDVVQLDEEVTVRVLALDLEQRRVSLSIKEARRSAEVSEAGEGPELAEGASVKGVVDRIERYGVFVKLSGGASALLPAAETGTPRGTDLKKKFPVGTELDLQVIAIDEQGRIKVSKTAREAAVERSLVDTYNRQQGGSGGGLGTLGDLLKGKLGK